MAMSPPSTGDSKKAEEEIARRRSSADHDAEIAAAIEATAQPDLSGDELPPTDLLAPIPPHNHDASKRELDAMGQKLMDALRTFRVDGELVGRTTGPGRHAVRDRAGAGREGPPVREPLERPRAGDARAVDPRRRADSRARRRRRRGAESGLRDRLV